jgi:quercetin dioxygenase-like cupin family protein
MKLGNETYLLNEGDSIYYPTNIPHSWKALNSESIEVIWVVTPPSF